MKNILWLFLILLTFFILGCSKEEATGTITGAYDIKELESIEDIVEFNMVEDERENITTVRLCHDTDNGMVRWRNGTVFGFYNNAERFEFKDYCFDNNILVEYYCENEIPRNRTFLCTNECEDNHCL